jgi:hypothetical protein
MILALLACTPSLDTVTVHVPAEHEAVFREFAEFTGYDGLLIEPGTGKGPGQDVLLELDPGLQHGEYTFAEDGRLTLRGGSVLALQHGLAALLEEQGFRFVHPEHTVAPESLGDLRDSTLIGQTFLPETPRNGLKPHTIHPIEAYYDLWEPSEGGLHRSRQFLDWVVKNRGSHVQWPALDNIWEEAPSTAPWQEHTRAIFESAHARGLEVGLGVQLFGSGNLQRAFDLVDIGEIVEEEVDARLEVLAATGPDEIVLSFGEFSGEEPETFVQTGNQALARMRAVMPGIDLATVIHVGNYEDLRVEYQGEQMLYYFLAKYMDARPQVHTVMYYNLFDDAGGAYLHDEFDEHRAFLLEGLQQGQELSYYPESAYWVAFDNSVLLYLPVYIRSRFVDLQRIRAEGGTLPDHLLFSSGWEWGYWQTDMLTLQMVHQTPSDWGEAVRWLWRPWGEDGEAMAEAVVALGELQHQALIVDRLAPYLAGRDALIDLGDSIGILSQPDRPQFSEIAELPPEDLAALDGVVTGLAALSEGTASLLTDISERGSGDPWFDEVKDGMEIDVLRASYVAEAYSAVLAHTRGQDSSVELAQMQTLLQQAQEVVARRRSALLWGGGDRILAELDENETIYRFGYLAKADTLCYWQREQAQVSNLIHAASEPIPPCT